MKFRYYPTVFVMLISLLAGGSGLTAATQDASGEVTYVAGEPDKNDYLSFSFTPHFIEYMSRGMEFVQSTYFTTYGSGVKPITLSMLNSKPVHYTTLHRFMKPGVSGYFYEDTFINPRVTPDFEFGKLIDADPENNTVTLAVDLANADMNWPSNGFELRTLSYSDDALFLDEDLSATEADIAEGLGNWLQLHPPRKQTIWVETELSSYDANDLPHPDVAGRGDANSNSNAGQITGYEANGDVLLEWPIDGAMQELADTTYYSVLDGKRAPNEVAYRPGRRMVAACYRSRARPQHVFVSSRNDEIRGEITAVSGSSFTVEAEDWDGNVASVTIDLKTDAEVYLDGSASQYANAVEVGRRVRVFPEHLRERLVLLKRYTPETFGASAYLPEAHFKPDALHKVGDSTFTFDGSFSYDHDGTIVSWTWDFGDGATASGPVVTHTYDPNVPHQAYPVRLTVENAEGERASDLQYITVMMEPTAPADIDKTLLTNGVVHKYWEDAAQSDDNVNWLWPTLPLPEPDLVHFMDQTNDFSSTPAYHELEGYLEAPEDGWYDFRVSGTYQRRGTEFEVGGHLVVDSRTRQDWGYFGSNNRLNGWVYLEAGLHRFHFRGIHGGFSVGVGWQGPGVEYPDGLRVLRKHNMFYNPTEYEQVVKAVASVDATVGTAPLTVTFQSAESQGPIASRMWDLGDGTQTTAAAPTHTYNAPGRYEVSLTVTDADGVSSTDDLVVTVKDPAASSDQRGISINFHDGITLDEDATAGIVPLGLWNNRSAHSNLRDDPLIDSEGQLLATHLSGYSKDQRVEDVQTSPDRTMMSDHAHVGGSYEMRVNDLPSMYQENGYDVIVYMNAYKFPQKSYWLSPDMEYRFAVNGVERWITMSEDSSWDGVYREATATTQAEAQASAPNNYFIIENLTDSEILITADEALVAGLQIVTDSIIDEQNLHLDGISPKSVGDPDFEVSAALSSGLTPFYEIISGPATVSGNVISLTGQKGLVTLRAFHPGTGRYSAVEEFASFVVKDPAATDQAISFTPVPDTFADEGSFPVTVTASSGLPVSLEVASGPATVSGNTVSLTGATGLVTLRATQAGNAAYNPAPIAYETFQVSERTRPVVFRVEEVDTGTAVSGASVSVTGESVATDAIGEAAFALPEGTHPYTVTMEDFVTASGTITVGASPVTEMVPLSPIRFFWAGFTVTDGEGAPLEGATISVDGEGTLTTDATGFAQIELLDATTYSYTAEKPTYFSSSGSFTVAGADLTEPVMLTAMPRHTVSFTVRDEDGTAVENASVVINGETLPTDASGTASIDLIDGSYDYTVDKVGYIGASGSVTVAGGGLSEAVTIEVIPTYPVLFVVRDDTDEAEAGVAITVDTTTVTTDAAGEATLDVPDGTYTYTASKADHFTASGSFVVNGSALTENVVIERIYPSVLTQLEVTPEVTSVQLGETVSFSVQGLDQYGNPMTAESVTWSHAGAGSLDAGGNFSAGTVPGTADITVAFTAGGTTLEHHFEVTVLADFTVISVNHSRYGSQHPPASAEAGANLYRAANWNFDRSGSASGLEDNEGNTTTASYSMTGDGGLGTGQNQSPEDNDPDNLLMFGSINEKAENGSATMQFTAPPEFIDGEGWDLVIYWYMNQPSVARYTLTETGQTYYMRGAAQSKDRWDGTHRRSLATTEAEAQLGHNYIVFEGITQSTVEVLAEQASGADSARIGMMGFQMAKFEAPPEPAGEAPVIHMAMESGEFIFRFQSEAGVQYQLKSSPDLDGAAGSWTPVGSSLTGDGTEQQLEIPSPTLSGGERIFYLLETTP